MPCDHPCFIQLNDRLDQMEEKIEPLVEGNIKTQKCEKDCEEEDSHQDCEQTFNYSGKGVSGIASQLEALSKQLEEMRKDICKIEAYAAVPEWWPTRAGANRPQLVVLFAEDKGSGKVGKSRWALTIPHFKGDKNKLNIPAYRKGQWEGILTLSDNSKLIVNGATQAETDRVINALKGYIDGNFTKDSFLKIGQRKGSKLKELRVKPITATYYAKGQQDEQPDWIYYFKK